MSGGEGDGDYENYDVAGGDYARLREPLGAEVVIGVFVVRAGTGGVVLDLGCGPFHYGRALGAAGFQVVGADLSASQLALAAEYSNRSATLIRSSATALPFCERVFDGVLINMVLHHLDSSSVDSSRRRLAISEVAKSAKVGAPVVIGYAAPAQIADGAWYYELLPTVRDRFGSRHLAEDELEALCRSCGLRLVERIVPLVGVFRPEGYFDFCGLTDVCWRRSTSVFAQLSDSELEALSERASSLESSGGLARLVEEHEQRRRRVGQITFDVYEVLGQ